MRTNNSSYGLGAGIVTKKIDNAMKISKRLKSGTIWVNCNYAIDITIPFGGFKKSSIGREIGGELYRCQDGNH
jgi:aldehyde dehydrogenase (NAD+)